MFKTLRSLKYNLALHKRSGDRPPAVESPAILKSGHTRYVKFFNRQTADYPRRRGLSNEYNMPRALVAKTLRPVTPSPRRGVRWVHGAHVVYNIIVA